MKYIRLILASIILVAVVIQFLTFRQSPGNFLSYFTILSNVLVSSVLILSYFETGNKNFTNQIRGAATLYILITGLGFTILLGGKNEEFLGWVNIVLHYVSPVFMLLDWVLFPSKDVVFKKSLTWIVFLVVYLVYSFVRGLITSWYPYEFLNIGLMGIKGVVIYVLILLVSTIFLTWAISKISTIKTKPKDYLD